MAYKIRIIGILSFLLFFSLVSCSEKKDCEFARTKEKLDLQTISKAKQIFIVNTSPISYIIVVENVDSLEWYDKYILFYDNQNNLVDYVFTESMIDSVNEGCVYFTGSIYKRELRGKVAWPNIIPMKRYPYRSKSITTYDVGIVEDYSIKDSSILLVVDIYDKPLSRDEYERRATKSCHDTDGCIRTDTISSLISNVSFDYSTIELTPNDHLKSLRFRRITLKKDSFLFVLQSMRTLRSN